MTSASDWARRGMVGGQNMIEDMHHDGQGMTDG